MNDEEYQISPIDKRRYEEKRGEGEKADYVPWVLNHEETSNGFSTRLKGMITGREHHLPTEGHTRYFRILDICPNVTDIKETFPLPLPITARIARQLNIPHPHDANGAYRVITTSFFVTIRRGAVLSHFARCYVRSESLCRIDVQRILEIKRRCCQLRNIDWGIVTEKDVPKTLFENAELVHGVRYAELLQLDYDGSGIRPVPDKVIEDVAGFVTPYIARGDLLLNCLARQCDETLGFKPGVTLLIVKRLLNQQKWPIDFRQPIKDWLPLPLRVSGNEQVRKSE